MRAVNGVKCDLKRVAAHTRASGGRRGAVGVRFQRGSSFVGSSMAFDVFYFLISGNKKCNHHESPRRTQITSRRSRRVEGASPSRKKRLGEPFHLFG
ncbi:hypothetical protein EVAR_87384_1 [Eumeta japonica]|uniref:Uncharacterized protein n=1 Tax=Eumeta variegata TaxID=151549 RepID=A0A4C1Y297_EUMVA|nr:hypothetical protein EVAR_87384_1 [Eumeta japonica]